jgi:hypothetical protein
MVSVRLSPWFLLVHKPLCGTRCLGTPNHRPSGVPAAGRTGRGSVAVLVAAQPRARPAPNAVNMRRWLGEAIRSTAR